MNDRGDVSAADAHAMVHGEPDLSATPSAGDAATMGDVDDALSITDSAGDDDDVSDTADVGNIDALLSANLTHTAMEECPPHMTTNYLEALAHSDPRAGFEMLHLGALRAMEAAEGIPRAASLTCEPCDYVVPETIIQTGEDGRLRFHIPSVHPLIERRMPMEREEAALNAVIAARTRQALADVLDASILEQLHRHSDSLS